MEDFLSPHLAAMRNDALAAQMDWRVPLNPQRPTEPLDEEGVAAIEGAVTRLLRDVGIEILGTGPDDPVLAAFRAAGAEVAETTVRLEEGLLRSLLQNVPKQFTLTPRNPARAITIGGRHMVFSAVSSTVDTWDLQRGRRVGDFAAMTDLLKLAQGYDCIHMLGGYPVEPQEIPAPIRHIECTVAALTLTDKVIHAYPLGRPALDDVLMLARLASGLSEREFVERPRLHMNINSLSPLRYDARVLDSAIACVEAGQAVIVTPYVVAKSGGSMSMAGAVALALAEGLAAIALLQAVRPGAPVVLGALTTHAATMNGAPVFGSPDNLRATQMIGQMARRYGLPFRATNSCTANIPDGQAMSESAGSLWQAVQSGANVVFHSAGWLGSGSCASAEKFVMDCEVIQMIQRYCEAAPAPRTTEELVAGILRAGNDVDDGHGQRFYEPLVSDWRGFEQWQESGAAWMSERANEFARRVVSESAPPPMDPAAKEAMLDHAARRRRVMGYSETT